MANKASWDDIPSLGVSIEDDNDTSAKDIDFRHSVRLTSQDICTMLLGDVKSIYVQVRTREGVLPNKGILQDINEGGMCFLMATHGMQKNDSIRIGAWLGSRPFKVHADVRWVTNDKIGVEYVNPKPEDVSFLSGLYAAGKMINRR